MRSVLENQLLGAANGMLILDNVAMATKECLSAVYNYRTGHADSYVRVGISQSKLKVLENFTPWTSES